MNEPYKVAFVRAMTIGSITGSMTFLTTWATTSDAKTLFITATTAFLTPFATRFGAEGRVDSRRASRSLSPHGDAEPALAGAST